MRIGETWTIRGRNLTIIDARPMSNAGSRYFGITLWVLRDNATGQTFHAAGKRLTANSKLVETA